MKKKNKAALIEYLCSIETDANLKLIGDNTAYHHEEADVKIISYLLELLPEKEHIQILGDDTDIFVLLLFFIWHYKPQTQISMRKYNNKVIDINATVSRLGDKCYDLLAVHALSGCDTVSFPFGKGKTSAINAMLKCELNLKSFTDSEIEEQEWMKAGMDFLSYLYSGKIVGNLSDLRCMLFSKKRDPPKIKSLPPTTQSAAEHIKRARLQVLLWRAADKTAPPAYLFNISLFGWQILDNIPVPVYGNSEIAPKSVLQLIACRCKSEPKCSRNSCSCLSGGLPCTTYCNCKGSEGCANNKSKYESTPSVETDEDEHSDEDTDEQ